MISLAYLVLIVIYFVEEKDDVEDDVSVATKNVSKKRKYSENMSDVMSLKSQSTSRYRGTFRFFST